MIVWKLAKHLDVEDLQVPFVPLRHGWWGEPIVPAPSYALVADPDRLWLVAARGCPGQAHPGGGCGEFVEGLWKYDVAELFVAGPCGYLEFNLSPAGAWWCARFSAPRVRHHGMPQPRVVAHSHSQANGGWLAALGIPLDDLRRETGFDEATRINVTMILGCADQQFLSVADLGGGQPDFHRPAHYQAIESRCT